MFQDKTVGRGRAVTLIAATLLCGACAGAWAVWLFRFYAEAPIVAFGRAEPQLERLSTLLAVHFAVAALLLLATFGLGWAAGREIRRGRKRREAERLLEN